MLPWSRLLPICEMMPASWRVLVAASPSVEGTFPMARVLVAGCKQEVASFNPVAGRYADFAVAEGEALFAAHRGKPTEVGGALAVLEGREGLAVAPAYGAHGVTSGGELLAGDWARLAGELVGALGRAAADGAVDGVYVALHGAMAAEGEPDPEGHLLGEARRVFGERVPIVVSLDLHGLPTERMLRHADATVCFHTYPHVDFFRTGQRAARLLLRLLDGAPPPATARVFIPALVRGDELITATGRFGAVVREAQAVEAAPGGWSGGVLIGNPFTDVPALGTNVLVAMDDAERAAAEALRLAARFWEERDHLRAHLTPLPEAVRMAAEVHGAGRGTVILTDAADATSSGASGDSLEVVRALAGAGYRGRVLAPVVDPAAVRAAFAAGVGGTVWTAVGGALDRGRFRPLPVAASVRLLSDGRFVNESHGTVWDAGDTAVLEVGEGVAATLVVTSRPVSLYDRSLFLAHGQDPARFDAVVVKSPHCQGRFFADWAAAVVNVDGPGATSADLASLGHRRCPRPMFPLDPEVAFAPRAEVYRRSGERGARRRDGRGVTGWVGGGG